MRNQPNGQLARVALVLAILGFISSVGGTGYMVLTTRQTQTTVNDFVNTANTVNQYATQVAKMGTKTPVPTPVAYPETCPSGQADYNKRLLGDEGSPLQGYVTLNQFKASAGCWLEVRFYAGSTPEQPLWYNSQIVSDKFRTSAVIKLPNADYTLWLVVHISGDYHLYYTVEQIPAR